MATESSVLRTLKTTGLTVLYGALMALVARVGLRLFGWALKFFLNGDSILSLAGETLLFLGCAFVFLLLYFLAWRLRPAKWQVALALLPPIVAFGITYPASLRRAPTSDFHGVRSYLANQQWRDGNRDRPMCTYRINSHGFRMPEWSEKKPPGVLRVALVGDSYIFGMGVEEQHTIKAYLDERLKAKGLAGKVEVLNLGIPGNNLPTHVQMYELARQQLGADVVVLGITGRNDLANWDWQDEVLGKEQVSGFSLCSYFFEQEPCSVAATVFFVQNRLPYFMRKTVAQQAERLQQMRARDGAPPLLVLHFHQFDLPEPFFAGMKNVHYLHPPPDKKEFYLVDDGHPSPLGCQVFANTIADELEQLPELKNAVGSTGQ